MKCAEFRRRWLQEHDGAEAALPPEMRNHSAACPVCADLSNSQRQVIAALGALAEASSSAQASPRVEAELLREFRQRASERQKKQARVLLRPWVFAFATAAAVVAIAVMLLRKPGHESQPLRIAQKSLAPPTSQTVSARPSVVPHRARHKTVTHVAPKHTPTPVPAIATQDPEPATQPPAVTSPPEPVETPQAEAELPESDKPYYPIWAADEPSVSEGGQIIRVRVSHSAFQAAGMSNGALADEPLVEADVVVGRDGIARAYRLVK